MPTAAAKPYIPLTPERLGEAITKTFGEAKKSRASARAYLLKMGWIDAKGNSTFMVGDKKAAKCK